MSIEIIITVVSGIAAAAASGIFQSFFERKNRKKETLEDRINKLTAALKESSHLVSEVEEEIQSRQKLVTELQKDAEKYQNLIALNQEQVDAVAQLLQGELRKEGNKSFLKGTIVNFVFFTMGAGLSWYLSVNF